MAAIQNMGNYQGIGLLNMVLANKKNGNTPSLADFKQQDVDTATNLLNKTMSSFQSGNGPGSVELTNYPGLGYARGGMTTLPKYTADTVEHDYLTKSDAAMTEKEYEKAIVALAEKNAAAGITTEVGDDYFDLARSFVSVVSPDRKSIIAGASPNALIPKNINNDMARALDDDGKTVATYNPAKGWTNLFSDKEKARNEQFDSIYWSAYNAYVKANKLPDAADADKVENAVVGDGETKPTTIDVSA